MSELYLALRSRLPTVDDWVVVGADVLHQARLNLGIGREKLGRRIGCSSKTIERWEKDGKVRRYMLPRVAKELSIEIEAGEPMRVTVPPEQTEAPATRGELAELRAEVGAIGERVDLILEALTSPAGKARRRATKATRG